MNKDEVITQLSRLLGETVTGLAKIGTGGNSRVYRVETASTTRAAKFYFQRTADGSDRLEAEFGGLQFLWNNDVRSIPEPVMADQELQIAVYQFISGREIPAAGVTEGDIDQLADFLIGLRSLAAAPSADELPPAAEASFTAAGIVDSVRARLALLQRADGEEAPRGLLRRFLHEEFIPALEQWERQARQSLGEDAYAMILPAASRTLSPSDFGFHNALRSGEGRLTFLDFEYFGWDDPAKMICDFLWHPRSTMDDALKDRFARRLTASFRDVPGIAIRLEAVFPLFGLKWCMILLNEFRPENLARRRFASGSTEDTGTVLAAQLAKAKNTLTRVNQGPRTFS